VAHDGVILTEPPAAPHPGVGDTYRGGVDTLAGMTIILTSGGRR
jgi:hypothetical protein